MEKENEYIRRVMPLKVAVTGPESTGKSWLSQKLAGHFRTLWVPEYAREYLRKKGNAYTREDIELIARGQLEREDQAAEEARDILFCDTELLVTKIWSEHVFGSCPSWILEAIPARTYDLYLLCNIDLPWEPDPLREHPHLREYLFGLYRQELESRRLPFAIISGVGEERYHQALRALVRNLHLKPGSFSAM